MYVVATFEHSVMLEHAINSLEDIHIPKEAIFALPLEQSTRENKVFDTIHHSDGISLMDGATILGTLFAVLGAIYGFIWKWGPVIWGLIGLLFGFLVGLVFDLMMGKGVKKKRQRRTQISEVVVMIRCESRDVHNIKQILAQHGAISIGSYDETKEKSC